MTLKARHVGPCSDGWSEGKVLNRLVRWNREGLQLEAGPRHGELIVEQLGLVGSKVLSAPGMDDYDKPEAGDEHEFTGQDVTLSRGLAARCNYLSMDRADLQFSAEEVCRETAKPVRGSLSGLGRLARYLSTRPQRIANYKYQGWRSTFTVNVDANVAACTRTRKSTSGGVARWGRHVINTWRATHHLIANPPGRASCTDV